MTSLPRSSLPAAPTSLLGREAEVAALTGIFVADDVRLATLTGPPGVGKTRLALEVAARIAPRFAERASFVPLAPVRVPDGVLTAVAQSLGLREEGDAPLVEQLARFLGSRGHLLVLDNFEHLQEAAPIVAELLAGAPGLRVLATSRGPLRISGEHEFSVAPLALPELNDLPPLAELARSPAVALFEARARAINPAFALRHSNAAVIAQLCHRLEGIPLAIELAAARTKLLSPHALLERLTGRLSVLRGGARDLPPRQQTLEAAISWSYDLLSGEEKRLLAQLTVFSGSWAMEAVEALCEADGGELEAMDGMAALLDHSLVQRLSTGDGEPRFTMLAMIREYTLSRLEREGNDAVRALRRRHASYFLFVVEALEPTLRTARMRDAMVQIQADHDNLRAALAWSIAEEEGEIAIRLCAALWRFWQAAGHLTEGRRWIDEALACAASPEAHRVRALCGAGTLARLHGDLPAARSYLAEAEAVTRRTGDGATLAEALTNLGIISLTRREFDAAEVQLVEASGLWESAGDAWGMAFVLNARAGLAGLRWDLALSRDLRLQGLEMARAAGDRVSEAQALIGLGEVARHTGEYRSAQEYFEQALVPFEETGSAIHSALTLRKLGHVFLNRSDAGRAWSALRGSFALYRELDHQAGIAGCAVGIGCLCAAEGEHTLAARLLSAADAHLARDAGTLQPADEADRERAISRLRTALGDEAFEVAWSEGRGASVPDLVATVGLSSGAARPASPERLGDGEADAPLHDTLTGREREVLGLLAQGFTYGDIGKRLFISARTVDSHLRSIYAKLNVRSRHEAASYAARHDLA